MPHMKPLAHNTMRNHLGTVSRKSPFYYLMMFLKCVDLTVKAHYENKPIQIYLKILPPKLKVFF